MDYQLESMFGIRGCTIAVTGAAGAIGSGLCAGLVSLKANVAMIDVCADKLEQVRSSLGAPDGMVRCYTADITDEASVVDTFQKIDADFGGVYGLINCAGISHVEYLNDMPIEKWQQVMDVNLGFGA